METALTAPLLFLLFFAGIEFSRANMVRNVAENAALEGARNGILAGATAQQCIDVANAELLRLKINGAQVTVVPSVIDHTTPDITVVVSIPLAQNALPLSKFVIGKTLVQSIKLSRELD